MKFLKLVFLALLLMAAASSTSAWADRGHFHSGPRVGLYIGGPLFWPGYAYPPAYYPYYYSAPLVVAPSAPTYYIEKGQETQGPQAAGTNYWYYCSDPDGYYPYVKQCRNGWQRVTPQPPSPQ